MAAFEAFQIAGFCPGMCPGFFCAYMEKEESIMIELQGKYNTAEVFTDNVEQQAISQIINLLNQEFVRGSRIRIMPDTHAGAGCTIGTTMTVTDIQGQFPQIRFAVENAGARHFFFDEIGFFLINIKNDADVSAAIF